MRCGQAPFQDDGSEFRLSIIQQATLNHGGSDDE
jgi:hypothetical protein